MWKSTNGAGSDRSGGGALAATPKRWPGWQGKKEQEQEKGNQGKEDWEQEQELEVD